MSNISPILVSEEIKKNLLEQIQKGEVSAIIPFYSLFKIGDLNFKSHLDDAFLVDLSDLTIDELYVLASYTKWNAAFYYLRLACYNSWGFLSNDILLKNLETLSPKAKNILFERFSGNLESASDELLVLMAQDGSQDSLDVLFERYRPFVRSTIKKMKSKNTFVIGYDDEDLVQEGVLGLYKSKNDFKIDRRTKFKDFSSNVIKKHIGTLVKKSMNYKNQGLNESLSYHSPISSDPEETFEQLIKSNANTPDVVACNTLTYKNIIQIFTPLELKVLVFYEKGYSYEEIGILVDKNRKAVDNTIQRIRKKGNYYKKHFIDLHKPIPTDINESNSPNLEKISDFLSKFVNLDISVDELKNKEVLELALYQLYYSEMPYEILLSIAHTNSDDFKKFINKKKEQLEDKTPKIKFEESYTF